MSGKESFNIFDPHSHKRKKSKKAPIPPSSSKESSMTIKEMLDRIKQLQKDLGTSIESIQQTGGDQLKKITKLLEDKSNFSETEWNQIEAHKKELSATFRKAESIVKMEKEHQETKKISKERKGKTLGARRRWIDMR
jgi:hypothetical protein